MKTINTYINERLHVTSKSFYTCQPKTKKELREIMIQRIKDDGYDCDMNDIDVSNITDMSHLFDVGVVNINNLLKKFNGDISMWDVSNVKDMHSMFRKCEKFNCDLSQWDVSNVTNMELMFYGCKELNCDISRWDVSNVTNIDRMFMKCTNFKQNLDDWHVSNVKDIWNAFTFCQTQPKWYDRNKWETL